MKIFYFGFCILLFSYTPLFAQFSDSLRITTGSTATIASENYQPFWISSLQFGTITRQKTDLSTHVLFINVHYFNRGKQRLDNIKDPITNHLFFRYGIDLYHNNHFQQVFTKEAYVKAGHKSWG